MSIFILGDEFRKSLKKDLLLLIKECIDRFWGLVDFPRSIDLFSTDLIDRVENYVDHKGIGVYDIIMSLLNAFNTFDQNMDKDDVLESLSYAYQAVLYQQILSKLTKPVTETEVRKSERQNPICLEVISSQISMLNSIESGSKKQPIQGLLEL